MPGGLSCLLLSGSARRLVLLARRRHVLKKVAELAFVRILQDRPAGGRGRDRLRRRRAELERRALQAGYAVVDMQTVFAPHYARLGERFEFSDDGHWNALAHRLAAEAVTERIAPRSRPDRQRAHGRGDP